MEEDEEEVERFAIFSKCRDFVKEEAIVLIPTTFPRNSLHSLSA